MIGFICLFFPAVVSVGMVDAVTRRDFSLKQFIYRFCTNALIINLVCFLIKKFVLGAGKEYLFVSGDAVPDVSIVYIGMALVAAIVLGLIESLLCKKVSVDLEVNKNEKKQEQSGEAEQI